MTPKGPVTFAPELYWRLRTYVVQQALLEEQRRRAIAEAEVAYATAAARLLEVGERLAADIQVTHSWFDARTSVKLDDRALTVERLEEQ